MRDRTSPPSPSRRPVLYPETHEVITDGKTDARLIARLEELSDRPMRSSEAAEFMGMTLNAFNKIAPELPRCRISEARYVYLRGDLLSWLRARREAPTWWWRENRS